MYLHIILNFLLQQIVSDRTFTRKTYIYGMFLKSVACVALVHKTADEIGITTFSRSVRVKKISELVKKLQTILRGWLQVVSDQMWPADASFTTLI
jgi:hypothetical protein